jgi:hypothetical protein
MASDVAFAFAVVLAADPAGALGSVRFLAGGEAPDAPCPSLVQFAAAVERRSPLKWRGAGGEWSVEWP